MDRNQRIGEILNVIPRPHVVAAAAVLANKWTGRAPDEDGLEEWLIRLTDDEIAAVRRVALKLQEEAPHRRRC
jgi:hypothetical protein